MRVGGSSARMRATLAASNLRGKGGGIWRERLLCEGVFERGEEESLGFGGESPGLPPAVEVRFEGRSLRRPCSGDTCSDSGICGAHRGIAV